MSSQAATSKDGKTALGRYKLLVFSNPVAGEEGEFNRWYNEDHVRDCLATPGFVRVSRLKLAAVQQSNADFVQTPAKWRYCAVWDVETDDLGAFWDAVNREIASGRMGISPTITDVSAWMFEEISG